MVLKQLKNFTICVVIARWKSQFNKNILFSKLNFNYANQFYKKNKNDYEYANFFARFI